MLQRRLPPQQRLARSAWQLRASQQGGRGLQCCITPQQQPGLPCPVQSAPAVLLEVLLRSPRCCLWAERPWDHQLPSVSLHWLALAAALSRPECLLRCGPRRSPSQQIPATEALQRLVPAVCRCHCHQI